MQINLQHNTGKNANLEVTIDYQINSIVIPFYRSVRMWVLEKSYLVKDKFVEAITSIWTISSTNEERNTIRSPVEHKSRKCL